MRFPQAFSKIDMFALFLFILTFTYLSICILPTNIHGDGLLHALIARETAENGEIPDHRPYYIMEVEQGVKTYYPITYPRVSYVMMALFYLIGGESMLKFFSPFFGSLVALFIYFLLRRINKPVGGIAGFLAIVFNSERFIMVPLIEQFLLASMTACIYFYYLFLKSTEKKYAILTALFLGLAMSLKQQGLVFFALILTHALFKIGYDLIKKRGAELLKPLVLLIIISIAISSIPLYDQIKRNGTLSFVPGNSQIPFLVSKFPANQESMNEIDRIVGYWPVYEPLYESLIDTIRRYFLHPIYYRFSARGVAAHAWFYFLTILYILGITYLSKKDTSLLSLLFFVSFGDVAVAYFANTPLWQYHLLSLSILPIFLLFGLFGVKQLKPLHSTKRARAIIIPLLACIIVTMILASVTNIHENIWIDSGRPSSPSGRLDDYHLEAYKDMAIFVQNNTPEDAIFLTTEEGFMFFSKRDAIWLNEGGGAKVPLIFETADEKEALYWLKYYNISYVFIDNRQTGWRGYFDYIPSHGLLDYIDKSAHFKKVYTVYSDNEVLRLYKVIYPNNV